MPEGVRKSFVSTVPILKYLFTDVGDDPYVTACALLFIESMREGNDRANVIIHITKPLGVTPENMHLFNKVQVRFGALDNLKQMRDMVFTKENVGKFFKIN